MTIITKTDAAADLFVADLLRRINSQSIKPGTLDLFAEIRIICPSSDPTDNVITVVIDEKNLIGKKFSEDADGSISKCSTATISRGAACQFNVPDLNALQSVLTIVSENPNAAICNSGWSPVPIGQPFLLLSQPILDRMKHDPEGVHEIDGLPAFARILDHATPSSFVLLDRDVDDHTPDWARDLTHSQWINYAEKILPGLASVSRLRAFSSSSRILKPDGSVAGAGNGHTWIMLKDPDDVTRVRSAIIARAHVESLVWSKPRHSTKTGEVCGQSATTILDQTVLTPGRLVFVGRPTCSAGLAITPQEFEFIRGSQDRLDTSLATVSRLKTYVASAAKGTPLRIHSSSGDYATIVHDLCLETAIELGDGRVTTVRDLVSTLSEKIRCQSPFRASTSMAAFIALDGNGDPFVYDSGTHTLHRMHPPVRPKDTARDQLVRRITNRLAGLIGVQNAEAILDSEVLRQAYDSSFYQPAKKTFGLLNRRHELIELNATDFARYGIRDTVGFVFDADMLNEVMVELDLDAKDEKLLRTELKHAEHGILMDHLKLMKQVKSLAVSVDMFARSASTACVDGVATLTLPHRRFSSPSLVEAAVVQTVVSDYLEHFPEFREFLDLVLHSRFSSDRRHSFAWLHAKSSWGKGFLVGIFSQLGLVCAIQPKEIDAAMAGSPVGLSLNDLLRSWILFIDEFKHVSSEIKMLNSSITLSPKHALRCTVPLYTKLFVSAESVQSLIGAGVEAQFNNRFAYLVPSTNESKIEDRPLFENLGKSLYIAALGQYVADYLNDGVEHLRSMDRFESSRLADTYCQEYQQARRLSVQFGNLDEKVVEIVIEIRRCLVDYARWNISSRDTFGMPDSVQGLGSALLNTLKRTAVIGYVSEETNSTDRGRALVLGEPVSFVKAYLALSADRSTSASLQYKADEIAAKLHARSGSYRDQVRIYESDGSKGAGGLPTKKRGIAIFTDIDLV